MMKTLKLITAGIFLVAVTSATYAENLTNSNVALDKNSSTLLLQKLNTLQQQVLDLQNKLEVQTQDLQSINQQQKKFYKELDQHLNRLAPNTASNQKLPQSVKQQTTQNAEISAPAVNTTTTEEAAPEVNATESATDNSDTDHAAYEVAYQYIRGKDYAHAVDAMQEFITKYPDSPYIANAHYWLGELFLTRGDFDKATQQLETVIQKYPDSSKVSDAILKLAFVYFDQGNVSKAKQQFMLVKNKFPESSAARIADNRLQQME